MTEDFLAAVRRSPADFTDCRVHRLRLTRLDASDGAVRYCDRLESSFGSVRCLNQGFGWGSAGYRGEVDARALIERAHDASRAAPRRSPIRLAEVPPRVEAHSAGTPDPATISPAAKRDLLVRLDTSLRGVDRRIDRVRLWYQDRAVSTVVVASDGQDLEAARHDFAIALVVSASERGTSSHSAASFSGRTWDALEQWAGRASAAAERAVVGLAADPVRPGRYPVILSPRFAALWIHHAVVPRLLADGCGWGAALPLGTRIGSAHLEIGDDGTAPGLRGTTPFDAEGTPPRNTALVRGGVVVAHLHTRESAARADVAASGNGRATGTDVPHALPTNTYVAAGRGTADDLMSVEVGVYLQEPHTLACDRGRVRMPALHARMIRNGSLAEPVRDACLEGDLLDLLARVDGVAGDFAWDTAMTWCPGPAAPVPVSVGAPHLRIGGVEQGSSP